MYYGYAKAKDIEFDAFFVKGGGDSGTLYLTASGEIGSSSQQPELKIDQLHGGILKVDVMAHRNPKQENTHYRKFLAKKRIPGLKAPREVIFETEKENRIIKIAKVGKWAEPKRTKVLNY